MMCRLYEVSASGYYAWRNRTPSARAVRDSQLLIKVRREHAESQLTYGSPRVHRDLVDQGMRVSPKRIARLMREDGLKARPRRRFKNTTMSDGCSAAAMAMSRSSVGKASVTSARRITSSSTHPPL